MFPSIAEQLKENRKHVWFLGCVNLDKHSLMNIALNAHINMMKFAYNHLSSPIHDFAEEELIKNNPNPYQSVYMYPGSSVPDWFVYKTIEDYIVIDLSLAPRAPVSSFIFCFLLANFNFINEGFKFNITISDTEGEGKMEDVGIHMHGMFESSITNHVCVICDLQCSRSLCSIAKNMTRLKIKVEVVDFARTRVFQKKELVVLKGFGVNPI